MPNPKAVALLTPLLLLASCSRRNTITRDELRSQLTSAVSFAAEAEAFIDYVRQNRATRNYAEGHIKYLADEVNRSSKELHEGMPAEGTEQKVRECRSQLDSLADELAAVRIGIGNPPILARTSERIAKIRRALEQTNSSL